MMDRAEGASSAARCHSIEDLRRASKRRLPRLVFDFFDGGAEDESTLRANRQAFVDTRLRPRVLNDVARVVMQRTLVGAPASLPMAIAPTGGAGFGRHGADLAIARAAARFGIPYTLSTSATASIEQIADAAPGRLWFQAYILKDQAFLQRLIDRAAAAGYEALMITVDLPVGGKRERDLRNGLRNPFALTTRLALDGLRHPRWAAEMIMRGFPAMENLRDLERAAQSISGASAAVGRNYDPSFDWDRLKALRDRWPRALIVKGVMRADDAQRLAAMGCDALVVSNHGGRQLDGAMATFDALPDVLEGAGGQVPVLVDGGVRRGVDVLKACAAGAQGVLIGRATLYGAVAAGDAGALRALEILQDELARSLRLCGLADVGEAGRDLIDPASRSARARSSEERS